MCIFILSALLFLTNAGAIEQLDPPTVPNLKYRTDNPSDYSDMLDQIELMQKRQTNLNGNTSTPRGTSDLFSNTFKRLQSAECPLSELRNLCQGARTGSLPTWEQSNLLFQARLKFFRSFGSMARDGKEHVHKLWHDFEESFPFTRKDAERLSGITNLSKKTLFIFVCPQAETPSDTENSPLPSNSTTKSPSTLRRVNSSLQSLSRVQSGILSNLPGNTQY